MPAATRDRHDDPWAPGARVGADALRELANAVEGETRVNQLDRRLYATDASIYQVEPIAVVIPSSVDDASRAVEACARLGLPVLPRGGGTSLAGQCVNEAVVIDLSPRCDALTELDPGARTCRVEPGMTIDRLNRLVASAGLLFAPDPSTMRQACIGGCIGNNAAGSRSVLHGRTSDHVRAVDVCLADGRRVTLGPDAGATDPIARELAVGVAEVIRPQADLIRERFPKTLRRSAGYQLDEQLDAFERVGWDPERVSLAPLMCGSEGTLGLITGAELRLTPIPTHETLVVVAFSDLDDAIGAVPALLETGPSAVELLDDLIIDLARSNAHHRRHVELLPSPADGKPVRAILYIEYQSDTEDDLESRAERARAMFPPASVETYTRPETMRAAWALRRAGEPLLHGVEGARKPLGFIEDNAVPPERLSEFVKGLREIVSAEGTIASYYAHASVGVLHVRPLLDLRSPTDEKSMHRIATRTAELAKSLGGVMSGEHGDGRARGPLLEDYFGPEIMRAFRDVKRVFDPEGRMNPGNIVDPAPIESISEDTRVSAATPITGYVRTYFEYPGEDGLLHAAELCNGAGVCRKTDTGAMCPSFRATRDERNSPRGWGNALRHALTGQLSGTPGRPDWKDERVAESLGLCLSCKACRTECPSNVDIAQLKAEYLAHHHDALGIPRSARFYARFESLARLGSITPGIANALGNTRLARKILRRTVGIDERRSLPRLHTPLHRQWIRMPEPRSQHAPRILLLADAFVSYFEPEIGLATRRVLEAFGYRIELIRCGDLARAKISLGLLSGAVAEIDRMMARLHPFLHYDDRYRAVVVCEPSCLSAIQDEWLTLRTHTPRERRERLASMSFLPEQFIHERWEEHPTRPGFQPLEARAHLHAHCHQRAMLGANSSAGALTRAFGRDAISVPDATCCGMAGSFGLAHDRFDMSMDIANQSVVPMVEGAGPGDDLLATGASCRHQILDATGREALHPIQLLDRQLVSKRRR